MRALALIAWLVWLCVAAQAAYKPLGAPTAIATLSSAGTAFQPCPLTSCRVNVMTTLGGVLALSTVVTISEASSSAGTYTTVASYSISAVAAGSTSDTHTIFVPAGYWVKISLSNYLSILSSLTMTGVSWTSF